MKTPKNRGSGRRRRWSESAEPGPSGQSLVRAINATGKRCWPFNALLACVGVALGVPAPANADPSPFSALSCSCDQPVPGQHRHDAQQIMQGIQDGLTDPRQRSTKPSQ